MAVDKPAAPVIRQHRSVSCSWQWASNSLEYVAAALQVQGPAVPRSLGATGPGTAVADDLAPCPRGPSFHCKPRFRRSSTALRRAAPLRCSPLSQDSGMRAAIPRPENKARNPMDVKEAARTAKNYLLDLFEGEEIMNVGLEEIDFDDSSEELVGHGWLLATLGLFQQVADDSHAVRGAVPTPHALLQDRTHQRSKRPRPGRQGPHADHSDLGGPSAGGSHPGKSLLNRGRSRLRLRLTVSPNRPVTAGPHAASGPVTVLSSLPASRGAPLFNRLRSIKWQR